MIKILLSLALLLAVVQSTASVDYFEMLSKQEYGKTILQAVQLELNSGGKVDDVTATLSGMLSDADNERKSIQSNLQGRQAYCQSKQQAAKEVLDRATYKRADDEKKVPLKKEELLDKKQQSQDKDGEEERNRDRITAITQQRDAQRKEYEERRGQLIGFVAALQEAKKIVSASGASFLQKSIERHYSEFKEAFPQQGLAIMVELLLQTANKGGANPELVEKLVATIDTLAESIYDLQKEELLVDDQREQEFQKFKAQLENANLHLAATVATLRAQVQKLEQEILELFNDIESQKQLAAAKSKELADWVKSCNDEEKGLRSVFDSRTSQIEVLNEILRIFNSGLSKELRQAIVEIQIK